MRPDARRLPSGAQGSKVVAGGQRDHRPRRRACGAAGLPRPRRPGSGRARAGGRARDREDGALAGGGGAGAGARIQECSARFRRPRRPGSRSRRSPTCSGRCSPTCCRPCRRRSGARSRSRSCSRMRQGAPPDRRAVAFAFLGALRALAREGPVVVAVDDVQWLDGPSAFMVEFALRRLREEPVAFLLTLRTGGEPRAHRARARPPAGRAPAAHRRTAQPRRPSPPPERPARPGALAPEPASPPSALGREPVLRARARAGLGARVDPARGRRAAAGHARDARPGPACGAAGRDPGRAARGLRPVAADDGRSWPRPRGADPRSAPCARARRARDRARRRSHPLHPPAARVRRLRRGGDRWAPRALHRRLAEIVPDLEERARHLALGAEAPDAGHRRRARARSTSGHIAAALSRPRPSCPSWRGG